MAKITIKLDEQTVSIETEEEDSCTNDIGAAFAKACYMLDRDVTELIVCILRKFGELDYLDGKPHEYAKAACEELRDECC